MQLACFACLVAVIFYGNLHNNNKMLFLTPSQWWLAGSQE